MIYELGVRLFRLKRCLAPFFFAFGLTLGASAEEPMTGETYAIQSGNFEGHRVWVGNVERLGPREVVHLSVEGPFLPYKAADFYIPSFGHLPVDIEAFRNSGLAVSDAKWSAEKQLEEGYREWNSANGGVFTISISDAVADDVMAQQAPN